MSFLVLKKDLLKWIDGLVLGRDIFGPVLNRRGETEFQRIQNSKELHINYQTTMLSPRRFIYPSKLLIGQTPQKITQTSMDDVRERIIFGMHACDLQALTVLDRTFLGDYKDVNYEKLRANTAVIVLNCNKACNKKYPNYVLKGFCASMGAGPFLRVKKGYDIEITDLGKQLYLVETNSKKGKELIAGNNNFKKALKKDLLQKSKLEKIALKTFTKKLEIKGLPQLLAKNLDHPVYKSTADSRCLGCTNCTMVCPTCFCYNVEDSTAYDLITSQRKRNWDSCLELNFAKVHYGNFRESRQARLRQFVTHKLSTWLEQHGCFGCVGCGRCMTWCPTNIDLTEIAKKIQKDSKKSVKKGKKK